VHVFSLYLIDGIFYFVLGPFVYFLGNTVYNEL
jgi:hypothetical protein